jgi:hypothetical protein
VRADATGNKAQRCDGSGCWFTSLYATYSVLRFGLGHTCVLCGFWYAGEVGALTSASKALLVALGLAEPQEQVFVPRMRLTIGKEARWHAKSGETCRRQLLLQPILLKSFATTPLIAEHA